MPMIEVSVGELFDKFSILEIKLSQLKSEKQKSNVRNEIASHKNAIHEYLELSEINETYQTLKEVNRLIWQGMDRVFEIGESPTEEYDPLTREITRLNMERAFLKKKIDSLSNSELTEEKSYFIVHEK
jgi:hypothetical protein